MKADIFYSTMPHPSEDEWFGSVFYSKVRSHETPEGGVVKFPKAKFARYFKKMASFEVKDDSSASLERLWEVFNDASDEGANPLGTPEGQAKVRASGTHHTSMSVGDVVKIGRKLHVAVSVGFARMVLT